MTFMFSRARAAMVVAVIVSSLVLAGCETDGPASSPALQPLSSQMLSLMEQKKTAKDHPILVRIFKEESELEIWQKDRSGQMVLLKTYPICRWSGELGPKVREGDRQAPEGFYTVAPDQMNPNSSLYLSFNLGFPNAFDRAHGRTGSHLMVHGDCSSSGCYAVTDEQISEIYALAREAFFGGQRSFQVQAFPFRMTPKNMARHRSNPNMPFWRNLKEGYDHFEVTRQEPKIDICEKRYVFNAGSNGRFNPVGRCPALQVPEDVLAAVKDKQRSDEEQVADLIQRGTPVAAARTYADGAMHPTFLAAVQPHNIDEDGVVRTKITSSAGTIPANIRLPRGGAQTTGSVTGQPWSDGVMDRISRFVGLGNQDTPASHAKAAPSKQNAATPRAKPAEAQKQTATARPLRPKTEASDSASAQQQAGARNPSLLTGAQPIVPDGGFDGRFGAWR